MFLISLVIFVFGLILGSFLNCLVWRLHTEESLWTRSHCPKCLGKIFWHDNIPLLSFLFLRGRCRHCRQQISWQYPLVEFLFALLFTSVFLRLFADFSWYFDFSTLIFPLLRDWVFVFALAVVFIFDLRWQEVPMLVIWPASFIIIILNLLIDFNLSALFLSAFIGAAFFLIQYYATKKRGLGEGDIWLGLMMGLYFANWPQLVSAILISYLIGSLISIYLLSGKKKELKSKIALGPFLVFGSLVALFFGEQLISWYLRLL